MLGFYGWDTDEQQLLPAATRALTLARLAKASEGSDAEAATRLWLKSIVALDEGKSPDIRQLPRLRAVLNDPALAREQMDVLTDAAPDLVQAFALHPGDQRTALLAEFDSALRRFNGDETLSRADRLNALVSRVELARIDIPRNEMRPAIPASLVAEVREQVGRIDREVTNPYERQAVISSAAYALSRAGLWTESDELLKASLARSHSDFYLMSHLAGNAMKEGRKTDALEWYAEAFNKSEGLATRLQWGSAYLAALVDVTPGDSARIEATATSLFREAGSDPGAFYERGEASLKRVARVLAKWNQGPKQAAAVARVKSQLASVCGKLNGDAAAKASCDNLLRANVNKA